MAKRELRATRQETRQDRPILALKKWPCSATSDFPRWLKPPILLSWMYGLKPVPFNSQYLSTQDQIPNAIALRASPTLFAMSANCIMIARIPLLRREESVTMVRVRLSVFSRFLLVPAIGFALQAGIFTVSYCNQQAVVSSLARQLAEVANSHEQAGVATYPIPRPGQTAPRKKIAYAGLFGTWDWALATGVHTKDIDGLFRARVYSAGGVFFALILMAGTIQYILARNLARAMTQLTDRMVSVAAGEFDGDVPGTERRDEIGSMARALLVLRDHSREAAESRLDPLTGLVNRRHLMERLGLAIQASSRSGYVGGLMLIDLHRFKSLNDTHGHEVGDLMLREVASRLLACVGEGDTVARLGGDEFVVLMVDLARDEKVAANRMEAVGAKILAKLEQPFHLAPVTYSTSCSLGIALFLGDGTNVDDLLKRADLARDKAKECGRKGCRFFDPDMEATLRDRVALEADLRTAIAERQFELYYQPQIVAGKTLKGAEALIRWHHPGRGLILPSQFIRLAEETGLILPIGQWVLEKACRQLATWSEFPEMAGLTVAVNVSAKQFKQADFVEQLLTTMEEYGITPGRLSLELTESVFVDDVDEVIRKMHELQARGVSFSLDDFGTGYSSLSYLKRMPLDHLKIDRSFVVDVMVDPNEAAIAKTVVALARSLGLGVIAEGVETEEQREFLYRSGCDTYQGYLFGNPLPARDFEQFARVRMAA